MTAFAMSRVGTRTLVDDLLLTLLFAASASVSYLAATKVELSWAPQVGDAATIFVIVTLMWAPLADIAWHRRRRAADRSDESI